MRNSISLRTSKYVTNIRLFRRTPVGDEAVFECFMDILAFLASFHGHQLTHYDLHWSNILRSSEGNWFVIDFENEKWYIIEVELSHHPIYNHIQTQV